VTAAEQSLGRLLGRPPAGEPAFAAALRRAGAETFGRLGLPTVRHEEWLYTSLAREALLGGGHGALASSRSGIQPA
jgi:hypothetical protein